MYEKTQSCHLPSGRGQFGCMPKSKRGCHSPAQITRSVQLKAIRKRDMFAVGTRPATNLGELSSLLREKPALK